MNIRKESSGLLALWPFGVSRFFAKAPLGPLYDFFTEADRLIRDAAPGPLLQAVQRFAPLAVEESDVSASLFWQRLRAKAAELTSFRYEQGRPRSLWGVTPLVGIGYSARADRAIGVESDTLVFNNYYISSDFSVNLSEVTAYISKEASELSYAFRRYVLAWALLSYDIFHLFNDRGIIEPHGGYGADYGIAMEEMIAYRHADKALFTYAYGADHRMRAKTMSLSPLNFCMDCPQPGAFCVCDDQGGNSMLTAISKNATRMIGFGLSMDLLPDAYFMNYVVVDPKAMRPTPVKRGRAVLRVGHFPNHGFFKGTGYLEEAVKRLQAAGRPVELVKFSGVPREQIIDAMRGVDVIVDQLISGSFGLTAVEAMALGRPVIAHLRPGVRISGRDECPVIEATPATIEDVLDKLIDRREVLRKHGALGPKFVRRHHSVAALSVALVDLYRECLPLTARMTRRLARGQMSARRAANRGFGGRRAATGLWAARSRESVELTLGGSVGALPK